MTSSISSVPVSALDLQTRTTKTTSATNSKTSAEQNLQDVFSAVLERVGREGYVSSEPLKSNDPLVHQVGASWEQWFNEFSNSRYTFIAGRGSPSVRENKTSEDLQQDYKQILLDAYQKGGYATPNTYLQSLSSDELKTIQQVQHLADPIHPEKLSEEASLNLLLPPDTQVDANHDGLTAVGAAYTLRFPDSNTPSDVREAWQTAIEGLSESDRMTYVLQMSSQILFANMHTDSNGQYAGTSQPGDADWVNPMASPSFSYSKLADGWLEYLDRFRNQVPIEQYQRDQRFWTVFRNNLEQP